jgi:hypothetical protein
MALLLAGCSTPAPANDTGPIDFTGKIGLLAIDTTTRQVTTLTDFNGFGWMSPSGAFVTWLDEGYAVLLETPTNAREVVAGGQWVRIYDNATGLELRPGMALWRPLKGGDAVGNATIPDAPRAGTRWNSASDDLGVLAAEYIPPGRGPPCVNEVYVHARENIRSIGCHVRVASDGRAGWTEAGVVRVLGLDGNITNLTQPAGGDAANDSYVSHENPVFSSDGVAYLRLTGGAQIVRTEVLGPNGTALAKMEGATRVAFHDISQDGRFLLVRAFERSP